MSDLNHTTKVTKICWLALTGIAGIFACLYFWFTLFPGPITPETAKLFSQETALLARAHSFVPRILYISRFILQAALLSYLLFSKKGSRFLQRFRKNASSYRLTVVLAILSIWFLLELLALPFTYLTSHYWATLWGFSTQSHFAWWINYGKNAGIGLILTLFGGLTYFWLQRRFERLWWLICAVAFSLWLVFESFGQPVLISPLFNSFTPLADPVLIEMVDSLADQANLNVNEVLVMDASKQTTLSNAYFYGVGTTKRIVLYDTLLQDYTLPEIKAVLAHEIAHWQHQDILFGLLYGTIGSFLGFAFIALLLKPWLATERLQPLSLWAAFQLAFLLLLFVINPIQNSISRRMEFNADLYSLELTGDLSAEIQLQKNLAAASLADPCPPRFIVWFGYTHPPALERIYYLESNFPESSYPENSK